MTPCLLCPSPVVADGLCVPCGAKLWAAQEIQKDPSVARELGGGRVVSNGPGAPAWQSRLDALWELSTPQAARAFLDKLEAARKARAAAPLCPDGCMSHEDINSYGGAEESDDGT
jgi:hypothetical protein